MGLGAPEALDAALPYPNPQQPQALRVFERDRTGTGCGYLNTTSPNLSGTSSESPAMGAQVRISWVGGAWR